MIRKVAIIGPESTGKSTLSMQLAEHYQTLWVPEYARQYLEKNGTVYTYNTLLEIAKGQVALEEEYLKKTPSLLIIDTEMYVMKVWSEFVFQKCHQWIIDQAAERQYDLFLLCNIDLPWTYDALREYPTPEPRQQLFRMYHDIMVNQSVPWVIITGDYDKRLSDAIAAIDKLHPKQIPA